ncbi:hypothetical protein FNV43_RR17316 [Rhamnella rubrinervis]|uniref:Glycosyltransferase n=1 Tax=Rhamnella rubrinervis TaxID=2594499 RepID=A0A8K0DYK1_9ROSA|nr:hypothetical protein FNV43_RR17316 [Rhamnella rubrinervis]
MQSSKPHVALLSSPGMGHLIPVLELGKRLVTHHNFSATIFVVSSHTSAAECQVLRSSMSPRLCDIVELPSVDISGQLRHGSGIVTVCSLKVQETKPLLRSAMSAMKQPPTVLIVDLFGTSALEVADELGIPKYVYMPSNAWFLALTIYAPTLDKLVKGEYVDQTESFRIPGCKPLKPEDVVDPMLDRTTQEYNEYLRVGMGFPKADGILVNTWEGLQATTLASLRDEKLLGGFANNLPIYPIGPLTRHVGSTSSTYELLFGWLDKQPRGSVIFISFGSGGTLSYEQMTEVAWGLELSRQRFIWIVRAPTITNRHAAFFTSGNAGEEPSDYLPEGFISRTNNVGRIIPLWAPQVDILSHPSVGGFLTHCGWNSILESITNGVPMIAWPLYAEQRMNATLLTEELGVAVRPEALPSKKVVEREEIAKMVRMIMVDEQGFGIRAKVTELKQRAEKASSEGGSSHHVLSKFAKATSEYAKSRR